MTQVDAAAATPWIPADTFATRLVHIRKHLGLSQVEAARLCGVDDGSWSNWENGSKPRNQGDVVAKIAAATGCNREWLMWGGSSATIGYRCMSPLHSVSDGDDQQMWLMDRTLEVPDPPVLATV